MVVGEGPKKAASVCEITIDFTESFQTGIRQSRHLGSESRGFCGDF
jgi:hypothetical protein